jgi:hypothetical protein
VLLTLDEDLAREAQAAGCRTCGGRLHSARYPRKPRGGPEDLGPDYAWRLSFCCAQDGCRRRTTPPSVRYLGRRVYLGAVVVLVTALQAGITPARAQRLHAWLGVSMRTLQRWRTWWRTTFVTTAFWRAVQGRFLPPVPVDTLPAALRDRFHGPDERSHLVRLLRFVCPLTTTSVSLGASLAMAAGHPQTMQLVSPSPRA